MKKIIYGFIVLLAIIGFSGCGNIGGIKIPENYQKSLPTTAKLNVPIIPQYDRYSCATTSLAMVMSYYDNKLYDKSEVWSKSGSSIADVTQKCGNDMYGLMNIAKSYGFTKYEFVSNLKVDELKYLITQNIPVVVNIRNFFKESYHAVAVVGYDEDGFIINDPSGRTYNIDYQKFKNNWYAHLCSPMSQIYYNSAFILYKNK